MKVRPIRKFSIDYRRYLGAAVLFVLLVLVLVKCSGPVERISHKADKDTETQEIESGNDNGNGNANIEIPTLEGEIGRCDDWELNALIEDIYRAYADNDAEAIEAYYSLFTDNERSYVEAFAVYKEDYENVECYAYKLEEGGYFVSPCYELKFYDVDTPAPGMDFFYVRQNETGNLYIDSAYTTYNFNYMEQELDAGVYAKILAYNKRSEVKDLKNDVQKRYEAAVAKDEKLANLIGGTLRNVMIQWQNKVSAEAGGDTETTEPPDTEGNTEEPKETEDSETPPDTEEPNQGGETPPETPAVYKVRARANCNIRAAASTNSARVGHAVAGQEFVAIGTENGWTKIEFAGGVGYIRDDLIRTVE